MENVTRTIYGAKLQTNLLLGLPHVVTPNTSLNQKFNIQSNVAISTTDKPVMKYLAIGNGGHDAQIGADGNVIIVAKQHRVTDAALYKHLPFVLRRTDDDIAPSERARYALRRIETHDGISYIAYYLRRLDLTSVASQMTFNTIVNGVTNTSVFEPTSSNLNPVPPNLTNTGVNVTTGDYVSVKALISYIFNESDTEELVNAATIIYGRPEYAIISEIGLVSGVDKMITVDNTFNFNEVIGAEMVAIINAALMASFNASGFQAVLDVGATEPLFLLEGA